MPNFKKGLTLLEIIVAVLIMSLGLIPIVRFAPTILRSKANTEQITESAFLATRKIEEVRGKVLDDFAKEGGYAESNIAFPAPHSSYRYTITDDLNPVIKTISVSAWHVERTNEKLILHTKIANRGSYRPSGRVANFTLGRSYHWIQEAVNEAGLGHDIRTRTDTFTEGSLLINVGIDLSGGWNEDFTARESYTTINSIVTIDLPDDQTVHMKYFTID